MMEGVCDSAGRAWERNQGLTQQSCGGWRCHHSVNKAVRGRYCIYIYIRCRTRSNAAPQAHLFIITADTFLRDVLPSFSRALYLVALSIHLLFHDFSRGLFPSLRSSRWEMRRGLRRDRPKQMFGSASVPLQMVLTCCALTCRRILRPCALITI